jgi:hypothetical protein
MEEGGGEFKASVGDDGNVVLKKTAKIREGKASKAAGGQFELRVRKDLEEKGWIVDKWSNNIFEGKVVVAKKKFNPFSKVMAIGTGFPDFVCFQLMEKEMYKVIGVEVKMNGKLSREEKEKCRIYLELGIFSEILVASKVKEGVRVKVKYVDVGEVLERMR